MKNFKFLTLTFFAVSLLLISCSKEELPAPVVKDEITPEVIEKFKALNFNTNGLRIENVELPDGTRQRSYIVEEDMAIPVEKLDGLLEGEIKEGAHGEQYRTTMLVCGPRTIKVLGYTGGSYALTNKMRTGLSWAVYNYNKLNLRLSFTLSYGTNTSEADIVVYKSVNSNYGGSAGPPINCNPYKWVRVYSGTDNQSQNLNEQVICHEIGHCIGFRHTDWFNRASCAPGDRYNEGDAGVGAIHVPGTPTGQNPSLMNACYPEWAHGELEHYDKVALQYMYGWSSTL